MKRTVLVLSLILALLLSGCGQSVYEFDTKDADGYYESPAENWEFSTTTAESAVEAEERAPSEGSPAADSAEKIIYTADLSMETTEFDETLSALECAVEELGGFTQNSSVSGDTSYGSDGSVVIINRYAYYTVRIPSAKLDEFLTRTGGLGNVTYSNKSAENVTAVYADYARRQASLEVEENRLLELIAQAEKIEDLIVLEDKLSDVRYEIESIQGTLQDYDRQVAYSTVSLSISEVSGYRTPSPVRRTFGQRLSDAFGEGWASFVDGMEDLAVGLAEGFIPLLLLAAVIVVVIVLVKKHKKKKKQTAEAAKEPEKPE